MEQEPQPPSPPAQEEREESEPEAMEDEDPLPVEMRPQVTNVKYFH